MAAELPVDFKEGIKPMLRVGSRVRNQAAVTSNPLHRNFPVRGENGLLPLWDPVSMIHSTAGNRGA